MNSITLFWRCEYSVAGQVIVTDVKGRERDIGRPNCFDWMTANHCERWRTLTWCQERHHIKLLTYWICVTFYVIKSVDTNGNTNKIFFRRDPSEASERRLRLGVRRTNAQADVW